MVPPGETDLIAELVDLGTNRHGGRIKLRIDGFGERSGEARQLLI